MAEVIAVGASVIAVIQISERIIGLCKFYIETARDAPSDFRAILIELSMLKTIFENLNFLTACSNEVSSTVGILSDEEGSYRDVFDQSPSRKSCFLRIISKMDPRDRK